MVVLLDSIVDCSSTILSVALAMPVSSLSNDAGYHHLLS
jgi:hypothetical protein